MDKFAAAEITPAEGQTVKVPVIKGTGLHLECRIVEKREMAPENFDKALADRWYADKDWHTYYTGEITAAYLDK